MTRQNVTSILFDGYTPPVLTWLLQEKIRITIFFFLIKLTIFFNLINAINLTISVFVTILIIIIQVVATLESVGLGGVIKLPGVTLI